MKWTRDPEVLLRIIALLVVSIGIVLLIKSARSSDETGERSAQRLICPKKSIPSGEGS